LSQDGVVLVTGISGNLGREVAKLLHRTQRVAGIDRRPFIGKPKDIDHFQIDLRKKKTDDVFRRLPISAIVHMGIMHDPRMSAEDHHSFNVLGTTRVLECAAKFGVKKLVVLSSANVYGPSPDNSHFLSEESPLMAASRFPSVRDLIEVDMLAHGFFWRHPSVETVVLRPVHIVGPTIKNAPSNYLRLKRPMALAGFDPMVQLIHMEDVARALVAALTPGFKGVFNVVGPGEVDDESSPAESRVVAMAQRLGGRIVTVDGNLVKIAGVRTVPALNVNEVALAIKPSFVPGDALSVRLVKAGEEPDQGVGYLDDGTMVVVENGRDQVGRTVHVAVTSTLQTTAGRLVFARPDTVRH
jgi:UDP-glucose 4-epimerase